MAGNAVTRPLMLVLLLGIMLTATRTPAHADAYRDLMRDAAQAIEAQDWERVVDLGTRLASMRPENPWAHYYRGLGLTNLGRLCQGDAALERALQLDPELFWAHCIRFYNALNRGDIATARRCAAATASRITSRLARTRRQQMLSFYASAAPLLARDDSPEALRDVYARARELLGDSPLLQALVAQTWFRVDMDTWRTLARAAMALVPETERQAHGIYRLPLQGDDLHVHQGHNDGISHLGLLNGYSWDFCAVDARGRYATDYKKAATHHIHGRPVLAAREGVVISVRNHSPDTEPGHNDPRADPNSVLIRHPDGESTIYCHLARGSVCVRPGDRVHCGQQLGRVGCSGRYVDFPHLHFAVYRNHISVEAPLAGYQVLADGEWVDPQPAIPRAHQRLRSTAR